MWASMVQKRRSVSAGTRGPSCGMSRSRQVRTKFSRQTALASSPSARKLSGNPPRIQSCVLPSGADFLNSERPEFDPGDTAGQGPLPTA